MDFNNTNKQLILIEMNELNYDFVREYLIETKLESLNKIVNENTLLTSSESEYEKLEPWIQWTSIHTGKKATEHKIFRLGDIVNTDINQIFEIVENNGYSVGCISPMNTLNKLSDKSTFIPDPWTQTKSDNSWWSRNISSMIKQTVNDNSNGKLSIKSFCILLFSFIKFVRVKKYYRTILLAISSLGKPWRRALFFDRLIHEINMSLIKNKSPEFDTVFFNSMAHIQHHYLFNSRAYKGKLTNPDWYIKSKYDPFLEGLIEFDDIFYDYINMKGYDYLVVTGLTQTGYGNLDFYWRLRDHKRFIDFFDIKYKSIFPRMTRDFLIEFNNEKEKKNAILILSNIYEEKTCEKLFKEIDERENSIFVTLTYSNNLKGKNIIYKDKNLNADKEIVFVAIKNGEHSEKGFLSYSKGIKNLVPNNASHVSEVFNTINNFFEGKN